VRVERYNGEVSEVEEGVVKENVDKGGEEKFGS